VKALSLHVTGIVQGVGFRPFVYNLARAHDLEGWVLNATDGVHVVVQGAPEKVDAFPHALRAEAPPMSAIDSLVVEEVDPEALTGFEIRESKTALGATTLVSPDIATCEACRRELTSPGDRRYGYPFINCTNCGPRFTIIESVPYDRPATTMRDFPMCEQCAAEYGDPSDRRFHAQPDACFICGPRLYLNVGTAVDEDGLAHVLDCPTDWPWMPALETSPRPHRAEGVERDRAEAIVAEAVRLLAAGGILAIKGLGGFQLACDATDENAVTRLRKRKQRYGKPFAAMVADLDAARALGVEINPDEAALLSGTARPIVLLRRVGGTPLAPGVADDLAEIGVMLPYTPLHELLLAHFGGPLVMTSGNLSEEPIATGNAEALARLASIADAFLLHDRPIAARFDDSVTRVVADAPSFVRRARGYAPYPLTVPFESDTDILAVGPEQKNTVTLLSGHHAFVSQHIGDLENAETLQAFEEAIERYQSLFAIEPHVVAHDLHPEYLSTKWALASGLPTVGVQHHHAHIVSVTAEHGVDELGVQEALEQQAKADRIEIGDGQRIGDQRTGAGAAAGTDRNVMALGPFDEVRHDQEVARIVHAVDHVDLEGETLLVLLFRGAGRQAVNLQAPCEPLPGLALQLGGLLGFRVGA
jgi:hydrogenase maturation protein HypF